MTGNRLIIYEMTVKKDTNDELMHYHIIAVLMITVDSFSFLL